MKIPLKLECHEALKVRSGTDRLLLLLFMDLKHSHPTVIYVLEACHNDDAPDLFAIGGENEVEVVEVGETECRSIATFHVGGRITAISWSPRTVSPSHSDQWTLE